MSPILKKALFREWLHQSGLTSLKAWMVCFGIVALFAIVGTLEGVM